MTNAEAWFNKSLRPRKPEGSLGRTAQDGHLDSHTAPELCSVSHMIQPFIPHVEPNTKMVVKKCNFIHKVPENWSNVSLPKPWLICFEWLFFCFVFYRNMAYFYFCPKNLEKVVLYKLLSHLQENDIGNPFSQPIEQDTVLRSFCYVL